MKRILIFICVFGIMLLKSVVVHATDLRVINEINDISINYSKNTLDIKGWAFVADAQNYLNSSTHDYDLTLKSKNDTIHINAKPSSMSHTDTMFLVGKRYCNNNEFGVSVEVCNNYYENIGFNFSVPLDQLKMEEDYVATLTINAKSSGVKRSVEVYFPNKSTINLSQGKKHYIIDSKLNDMSLKVLDSFIYVRDKAGKSGNIFQSSSSCSNNKNLYYNQGSRFNKIFDKAFLNNTTYYQLSGKENGCKDSRMRVSEGNHIKPMWIASNFVELLGEPLTIKTRNLSNDPQITITDHPTLYINEEVDIWKGVSAFTKDGKDITDKVVVVENNVKNEVGSYTIQYSVTDEYGDVAYGTKNVTIINRNHPPVIVAEDVEINQFDPYNPYDHAEAYDQDNNNISDKLKTTTTVDTSILKDQKQCYEVIDKYGLKTSKCINITINKAESNLRFIQHKRLFYLENTPKMWDKKQERLQNELSNEIIYDIVKITR